MLIVASWASRVVVLSVAILVTTSFTMSGEWGEEGVTYGELGKDMALTCPGANPSSTVRWQQNGGSGLPKGFRDQRSQLLLPCLELSSEGIYSCYNGSGILLGSVTLRVGRVPGLPNISCRASNYENFSCFWASSIETFLPTRYISTYQKQPMPGSDKRRSVTNNVRPCIQDPDLPLSCTVSSSQFWSSYRVNVTEVNPLGSSFRLLDITMQTIIKPDPPEGLQVETVPLAPRRLRVSWQYPSTWPKEPFFLLKFQLRYRPVIYHSWSVVETANLSEVITDAFMGLEHVAQVSAKDFLDAGSWSEWSTEAWGKPAAKEIGVAGPMSEPREAATATVELEMPAKQPSLAPNNEPVAGHNDSMEKIEVLVSLGLFAFFVLAAILVFAFLMWIHVRKQSKKANKNHDLLAAAIHMKSLPKAQIW